MRWVDGPLGFPASSEWKYWVPKTENKYFSWFQPSFSKSVLLGEFGCIEKAKQLCEIHYSTIGFLLSSELNCILSLFAKLLDITGHSHVVKLPEEVVIYFFGGNKQADQGWSKEIGIFIDGDGGVTYYCRERDATDVFISGVELSELELNNTYETIESFLRGSGV